MQIYSKEILTAANSILIFSIIQKGESYGYHIIKTLDDRSDGRLDMKEGTLYPLLKKLHSKGYLNGRWKTAPSGHRRRYYTLSQSGILRFRELRGEWADMNKMIEGFE